MVQTAVLKTHLGVSAAPPLTRLFSLVDKSLTVSLFKLSFPTLTLPLFSFSFVLFFFDTIVLLLNLLTSTSRRI